uniref:Uncharacterized protein n=1 Tax=Anguilla anguilla TaxID=7936 RepID=A0A0E9UW27_ANGAN
MPLPSVHFGVLKTFLLNITTAPLI